MTSRPAPTPTRCCGPFYTRAIDDALLHQIFIEVANMDLEEHPPAIGNFWEKVLFSTSEYNGNVMHVHRHLHDKEPLKPGHFERCGTRPSAHTTRGPPPPEPSSTPPASSWPCSATSTRRPCTDQPAGRRARDQGSRWRTRRRVGRHPTWPSARVRLRS